MKRPLASALAIAGGGLLGLAATRLRGGRKKSTEDTALRRLTATFIVPAWIAAGFADYLWHRKTLIETTSGLEESVMHSLMMLEAAPPVLAGLFLEINAGALAWMIALSMAHELTVLWDLAYTTPRRVIPAGEQITHTFLESPPFLVTAAAIATHWPQFQALTGRGGARPDYQIRLQSPAVPLPGVLAIFAAMILFGALPHADELRRCVQAKLAGRTGVDTPPGLPELFS
ncbi:MAG TPA: hypothetical protein VG456_14485 [Candidatus Sulfopaludibacter sp.]|jgi:hypothetical protein|nr:hypothetical protein [Candidatus Sulfopaludibacter sp.]